MTLGTLADSGPGCGGWGHQLLVSWKSERVSNLNISLIERQRSSALLQPTALWTSLCCSLSTIGSQIPSNINNAPLQFGHRCTLLLIIFGEVANATRPLTKLEQGKKVADSYCINCSFLAYFCPQCKMALAANLIAFAFSRTPNLLPLALNLKSNCHHDIIMTTKNKRATAEIMMKPQK